MANCCGKTNKGVRGSSKLGLRAYVIQSCNDGQVIMHLNHCYCVVLGGRRSWVLLTLKGWGSHKVRTPKGEEHGGHLKCLPTVIYNYQIRKFTIDTVLLRVPAPDVRLSHYW